MTLIGFSVMLVKLPAMLMSFGPNIRMDRSVILSRTCSPRGHLWHLVLCLWVVAALLSCLVAPTSAEELGPIPLKPIIVRSHFRGYIALDGYVQATSREAFDTTFDDIFHYQAQKFRPTNGSGINLGFVNASGWLRFAIERAPDDRDRQPQRIFLSLLPNMTNFIDVFVAIDRPGLTAHDFTKFEMGSYAPLLRSSFNGLDNILPLALPESGRLIIYARAANIDSTLNLSAALYSPEGYGQRILNANLVVGLWIGGMVILIAVQLVFFCLDRRRFYGLLALYIFFTMAAYFAGLGLSRLFLFPDGGAGNDLFVGAANWLGLTTGTLCIASILELKRRHSALALLYRIGAAAGIVGVFLVLVGHNRWFTPVAGPLILAVTTTALCVASMDFWRRRHAEAALKLAAFALLWAGLILTNSQRYGVISLPNWVSKSYGATSIVYFILLTGSLAIRLRLAEDASHDADRKLVEAAVAAEAMANKRVAERTQELELAKRIAETALHAELEAQKLQVRFMEVISHQYRTPLAVVRSNLESVRFTLPASDAANQNRLTRATQAITRLVEVIEINLARSVLQGSSFDPAFEDVSLGVVLDHAVLRVRDLFPGAVVESAGTAMLERCVIFGDREMLVLAVVNLLENSIKFSPTQTPKVILSGAWEEGLAVLKIRDFGIGIPEDELGHVLSQGGRGSNASHLEGTGTGLSLVARIIAAHNGQFEMTNAQDGGVIAAISLGCVSV